MCPFLENKAFQRLLSPPSNYASSDTCKSQGTPDPETAPSPTSGCRGRAAGSDSEAGLERHGGRPPLQPDDVSCSFSGLKVQSIQCQAARPQGPPPLPRRWCSGARRRCHPKELPPKPHGGDCEAAAWELIDIGT